MLRINAAFQLKMLKGRIDAALMMLQVDQYLDAPFVLTLQLPTFWRVLRLPLRSFTLADEGVEGLQRLEDCGVIFYIHFFKAHCVQRQRCEKQSQSDVNTRIVIFL